MIGWQESLVLRMETKRFPHGCNDAIAPKTTLLPPQTVFSKVGICYCHGRRTRSVQRARKRDCIPAGIVPSQSARVSLGGGSILLAGGFVCFIDKRCADFVQFSQSLLHPLDFVINCGKVPFLKRRSYCGSVYVHFADAM